MGSLLDEVLHKECRVRPWRSVSAGRTRRDVPNGPGDPLGRPDTSLEAIDRNVLGPVADDRGPAETLAKVIDTYPDAMKAMFGLDEFTTPTGYLSSVLFSFMAPLIFVSFAIGMATDSTAGEKERRTLDLLMANPVTRTQIVLGKFAALLAGLVLIGSVMLSALWMGTAATGMGIPATGLIAATVDQVLLGACFGAIALTAAWATGRRGGWHAGSHQSPRSPRSSSTRWPRLRIGSRGSAWHHRCITQWVSSPSVTGHTGEHSGAHGPGGGVRSGSGRVLRSPGPLYLIFRESD